MANARIAYFVSSGTGPGGCVAADTNDGLCPLGFGTTNGKVTVVDPSARVTFEDNADVTRFADFAASVTGLARPLNKPVYVKSWNGATAGVAGLCFIEDVASDGSSITLVPYVNDKTGNLGAATLPTGGVATNATLGTGPWRLVQKFFGTVTTTSVTGVMASTASGQPNNGDVYHLYHCDPYDGTPWDSTRLINIDAQWPQISGTDQRWLWQHCDAYGTFLERGDWGSPITVDTSLYAASTGITNATTKPMIRFNVPSTGTPICNLEVCGFDFDGEDVWDTGVFVNRTSGAYTSILFKDCRVRRIRESATYSRGFHALGNDQMRGDCFEGCIVTHAGETGTGPAYGFLLATDGTSSNGMFARNCVAHNCVIGFQVGGQPSPTLIGCVAYYCSSHGFASDTTTPAYTATAINCTAWTNGGDGFHMHLRRSLMIGCSSSSNTGYGFYFDTTGTSVLYSNNEQNHTHSNGSAACNLSARNIGFERVTGDPLFIDPINGDFTPQPGSPLILDDGKTIGAVSGSSSGSSDGRILVMRSPR